MMRTGKLLVVLTLLGLILSACGASAPAVVPEMDEMESNMPGEMEEKDTSMEKDKPKDESMSGEKEDMMTLPDWYTTPLTDVQTGETFTIADLKGKVILVETMAMWCSNCMRQQREVKTLHENLGERDDFVSIGLDIDINEDADSLKDYVARNGFDWKYAVATPELAREIASLYGDQFLNPPSTPILIIDRKGTAHTLPFGVKSARQLEEALQPFLDEPM